MHIEDIEILFSTPAHSLEVSDNVIIDGELVIIKSIDFNRDDPDEVFVKVENLTDPSNDEIPLFADDEYSIWSE